MTEYLAAGLLLGLSAGFSPGPLMTLIISETLQHGLRSGFKVAIAPLLTDLPIVLITLFIISRVSGFSEVLGVISFLGAAYVFYLGYKNMMIKPVAADVESKGSRSIQKGVITNFLSPNPYLFWISVGAPTVIKAWAQEPLYSAAFLAAFYLMLVGGKVIIALITGRVRAFMQGPVYLWMMRALGLLLWVYAGVLGVKGIELIGN